MVKQRESTYRPGLGLEWASRVTTIGLMFALPPMLGNGADRWLATAPAGTIAGAVLGFVAGMSQIMRLSRQPAGGSASREDRPGEGRGPKGPGEMPA